MAKCTSCGSADQFGRYCTNCGGVVAAGPAGPPPATVQEAALTDTVLRAAPPVNLQKGPAPAQSAGPGTFGPPGHTGLPGQFEPPGQFGPAGQFGPPGPYQGPPAQNYPPFAPSPTGGGGRRLKGWLIAAAAFVVVALLATTAILVLRGSDSAVDDTVDPTTATQTAAPPESSDADATERPDPPGEKAVVKPSGDAAASAAPTPSTTAPITTAPATTAPTTTAAAAIVNPLTGPPQGIGCGSGFIVQVASELTQDALAGRIAQLQAANQLPAGSKWTDTSSSCQIFTTQTNVYVVYAGPYAAPYEGCPARLASPPDAFIKGTTPETSKDYPSCLCPTPVGDLPAITTIGQQGVWVGELQRELGAGLDYDIGDINADPATGDPGRWGVYTAETAAAVGRFQGDSGLPVTNQVDGSTWAVLQSQSC